MTREDWLCEQLDRNDLSEILRTKYNAELDRLADAYTVQQTKNKLELEKQVVQDALDKERLDLQYVEESLSDLAVKIAGDNAEQWLQTCLKLYTIDPNNNSVTSIAHGPENSQTWDCDTYVSAKKKILQLIRYKYRDHFERGNDFFYYPEEESAEPNVRTS
jgi:hypothetical protein